MINRKSVIYKDDISNTIDNSIINSKSMDNEVLDLLDRSNSLYTESSIFEDCILNKYLKTYNQVKDIKFNNKQNYAFTESFISEEYFDKAFHIDSKLNIDILNGDLTLPIKTSTDLSTASVIIENTSNGNIGTSIGTEPYNDINSILSSDSSKLFIYEKIISNVATTELNFNITLKLASEDICNAIYIKLYNDENTNYANITNVKTSIDGITFTDAVNVSTDENKADRYIRFSPSRIRYISISLKQTTYSSIQTNFGSRFRYIIGIREVTPKKIEYASSGEYVSTTLSVPKNINSLYFYTKDISNSDIKYYMSGNNGSKWTTILANTTNLLDPSELGLTPSSEVDSLKIKILADKSNIKFSIKDESEYLDSSLANTYFLSKTPTSINGYIGNHISYGNKFVYTKTLTSTSVAGDISIELTYIPYSKAVTLTNGTVTACNIVVEINGTILDESLYTLEKDVYEYNTILRTVSTNIQTGLMRIYYKPITYLGINGNKLILPQNMFFQNAESIFVYSTDENNNTKILLSSEIEIVSKDTIKIKEPSYNNKHSYTVLYNPELKIEDPITISENKISIPSMKQVSMQFKVRFDYSYETNEDTELAKYYTPICKEYTVEYIQ